MKTAPLSLKEQIYLIQQLTFLVGGGMTLAQSIHLLSHKPHSKKVVSHLSRLDRELRGGRSLASALEGTGFSESSRAIIKTGEMTGAVAENLSYLSHELAKIKALRGKVVGAMAYPVIVAIASFTMIIFLLSYIFPKVVPLLQSMNTSIPLITQFFIALSLFVQNYFVYCTVFIVIAIVVTIYFYRTKTSFQFTLQRSLLHLPFLGDLVRTYIVARSWRTLGLLLKSGITLPDALLILSEGTPYLIYKDIFYRLSAAVAKGKKVAASLEAESRLFPASSIHIITVGEASGSLSSALLYLADAYEMEVDEKVKLIAQSLEPALLIAMGLTVGLIALSIISPIYEVTQAVGQQR